MDPLDIISGKYGCIGIGAAGADTYDANTDTSLPQVKAIIIADGASITTLEDADGNDILARFKGLSTGNWPAHAVILAGDGETFGNIVTAAGSYCAAYTVRNS